MISLAGMSFIQMDLYISKEQDNAYGAFAVPELLLDPYRGWGYFLMSAQNPRFEEAEELPTTHKRS